MQREVETPNGETPFEEPHSTPLKQDSTDCSTARPIGQNIETIAYAAHKQNDMQTSAGCGTATTFRSSGVPGQFA